MKKHLFFIFCLLAVFFIYPVYAKIQSHFSVLTKTEHSVVLEFNLADLEWENVSANGLDYVTPKSESVSREPGTPQLTVFSYAIDLPPDVEFDAEMVDSVTIARSTLPILPAPTPTKEGYLIKPDEFIYEQPGTFPRHWYNVSMGQQGSKNTLLLTVYPLRYAATEQRLYELQYARFEINWRPHTKLNSYGPDKTPDYWYRPERWAAKIYTHEQGIVHLSGHDLLQLNPPTSLNRQTLSIYYRGGQIPVWVEPDTGPLEGDDKILFYAPRRSGKESYFHEYNDTQVFWLTFEEYAARRFEHTECVDADSFSSTSRHVVHFETDRYYHSGDRDSDVYQTELVPGEGWVWHLLNPTDEFSHVFDLPGYVTGQDSILLTLRLRGTTFDVNDMDHHAQISLNGNVVKDIYFNDRQEIVDSIYVNASFAQNENNQLRIESVPDMEVKRSQFFLDWFEIKFERENHATNGLFSWQEHAIQAKKITGFKDENIKIIDALSGVISFPCSVDQGKTLDITVRSAGLSDGNFAHFIINKEVVFTGKRGYNLVVLDGKTGHLKTSRTFDTWSSDEQVNSMVTFLNTVQPSDWVLFAIRDDGSNRMTDEAFQAIETFGSTKIRSVAARASWSMIARKNDATGPRAETLRLLGQGEALSSSTIDFEKGASTYRMFWQTPESGEHHWFAFDSTGVQTPDSLRLDSPSTLRSTSNGADYVIISHPLFKEATNRLKQYREKQDGFRVRIAWLNDIYDEFNFGLATPDAIKSFLQYAYWNWQEPRLQFAVLVGDATTDPRQHFNGKRDFVPSFGNPVSDTWFTYLDGPEDNLPDIAIGRIAVESNSQAQQIIDKIIDYESMPSALWKKTFLMINGGKDKTEQYTFLQQSKNLSLQYIDPPPLGGKTVFINKTSEGFQEGEKRQDILNAIDQGTVWVNFIGHAGSKTWDLMFHSPDIDELNNYRHYPFITSMTCHTGRFADPSQDSFSEIFLRSKDKGAIAFLGSTGWGFPYAQYLFLQKLYPLILQKGIHYVGEAIVQAKGELWRAHSGSIDYHHTILQYNLLGDPALKLAIPEKPDLLFSNESLNITPKVPSEADSTAELTFTLYNAGLVCSDSFYVSVQVSHPNRGTISLEPVLIDSLKLEREFSVRLPLSGLAGQVTVKAVADQENRIDELVKDNNVLEERFVIISSRIEPLSPPNFSMIDKDPVFKVQTPKDSEFSLQFELDKSPLFDSPFLTKATVPVNKQLYTSWKPDFLFDEDLYFWRVKSDADTFSHAWTEQSFEKRTRTGWRQGHTSQWKTTTKEFTKNRGGTVELDLSPVRIYVESAGYSDGNYARIIINDEPLIENTRGYNMIVLDPRWGRVAFEGHYDIFADSANAGRMAQDIYNVTPGSVILLAIKDDGSIRMTDEAFKALESIGSEHCRKLGPRDSWVLIGRKGAEPGSVPETWVKSTLGTASVGDTLYFYHEQGTVTSPRIGPTLNWKELVYRADTPENTSMFLDVVGLNSQLFTQDTLVRDVSPATPLDLSGIDAARYPELQLIARLNTTDGRVTPVLNEWQVEYDPVPDLAVGHQTFNQSSDTVLVGDNVLLQLQVYNIGEVEAEDIKVLFQVSDPDSGRRLLKQVTLKGPVPPDSLVSTAAIWSAPNRPGQVQFFMTIDPDHQIPELSETNNALSSTVVVDSDSTQPGVELTFDGRHILENELVAAEPFILARIIDNSKLAIEDTTMIDVFLDGFRLSFQDASVIKLKEREKRTEAALLEITPQLEQGTHILEVLVKDPGGNRTYERRTFRVVTDLMLIDPLNYPNPFTDETHITFKITQPSELSIKIFTLAGRLIKQFPAEYVNTGFHRFYWNGKDQDGDRLANGVYLAKITADTGTEQTSSVIKMMVMR